MTSTELITQFVSGGLLGMAGQTIRTFVGLTKANSENTEISISRIVGSLAIGFSAGGIGIFIITSWNSNFDLKPEDFMLLLSIGYAGTDFLEGFFRALITRGGLTSNFNQEDLVNKILNNSQKLDNLHEKVERINPETISNLVTGSIVDRASFLSFAIPADLDNITITFGPNVNKTVISTFALDFVKNMLSRSGNLKATITSSAKTPEDQARIMYDNIESKGVESQKKLYNSFADKVIDVYVESKNQGKNRLTIISDMTLKINQIGPDNISKHMGDYTKLVVLDIAPSSIIHKDSWAAVLKETEQTVPGFNFIMPPQDPAFHLEIPNVVSEQTLI